MAQNGQMNGVHSSEPSAEVNMDYLIVGTGPAGASLACFLTQHGETQTDHAHDSSDTCGLSWG
jgi:hypothetical protein